MSDDSSIRLKCPLCDAEVIAPSAQAGHVVTCDFCLEEFTASTPAVTPTTLPADAGTSPALDPELETSGPTPEPPSRGLEAPAGAAPAESTGSSQVDDDELGFADEPASEDTPAPFGLAKPPLEGVGPSSGNAPSPSDEAWLGVDEALTTPSEDHPAKKAVLTSDYEFSGPCPLCGTRYVATDDKIGTTIRCPDCHSRFEIREPLPTARQPLRRPAGSWDDDDDDFGLGGAVDLASIDDLVEAGLDETGAPGGKTATPRAVPRKPAPRDAFEDLDALDTDTSLPHDNSPRPMPEGDVWPREVPMSQGNMVLADAALRKAEAEIEQQEAEEKRLPPSPLTNGVLTCFSDPSMFIRWLLFALGIQIEMSVINGAIERAMIENGVSQLLSLMMGCFAFLFGIGLMMGGAVTLLSVLQDTASGEDRIEHWPDANFMDWAFDSLFVVAALFVSILVLPLGLVVFPIYLLATLETGLAVNPFSGPIFRSLTLARGAWIQFFLMSVGLTLVALLGWSLRVVESAILNFVAAAIVTGVLFLYFRLLGRLTWVCQEAVGDDMQRREAAAS